MVQYSMKNRTEEELREVTNPVFAAGEKLEVLLPGIDPFNLFRSNLSSTRFCSFPSSNGMFPVNPLEWKFLHEINKAEAFFQIPKMMSKHKQIVTNAKTIQHVPYITPTLLKPPNSEGIGPVSRLTLKSRTLRFLSEPICFGTVPKSRLWSKYLSRK